MNRDNIILDIVTFIWLIALTVFCLLLCASIPYSNQSQQVQEYTELLPCPFCGGEATTEYFKSDDIVYVSCICKECELETCNFKSDNLEESQEMAMEYWNTRE